MHYGGQFIQCHLKGGGNMADAQRNPKTQASVVGSCSATDCRYNEERECHAGEITVQMSQDGAHCATYDPETPKARP